MKRRLLIIPGYRLFPIETGAGVAQYAMIDGMRNSWVITLLINDDNVTEEYRTELQDRWPNVNFIFWARLRKEWEEWASNSIGYSIRRKLGLHYRIPPTKHFEVMDQARNLWANVGFIFHEEPEWRLSSLAHYLKKNAFDVVQTDLPSNLGLAAAIPSRIAKIHVCHELKFKRFEISAAGMDWPRGQKQKLFDALQRRETESLSKYDRVICFSAEDKDSIASLEDKVFISPFSVLKDDFQIRKRERPDRLVFIGPEHHGPNKEGLIWFLKNVWPEIDQKWKLHVIGKWDRETIGIYEDDRICFEGFVDDLETFYIDSIMVVPVLSGAGIRTKILQAMARRVPVISTPFAAQGIDVEDEKHIGLFDNALQCEHKLGMITEDLSRSAMVEAAFEYVHSNFSQEVLSKIRSEVLSGQL